MSAVFRATVERSKHVVRKWKTKRHQAGGRGTRESQMIKLLKPTGRVSSSSLADRGGWMLLFTGGVYELTIHDF